MADKYGASDEEDSSSEDFGRLETMDLSSGSNYLVTPYESEQRCYTLLFDQSQSPLILLLADRWLQKIRLEFMLDSQGQWQQPVSER